MTGAGNVARFFNHDGSGSPSLVIQNVLVELDEGSTVITPHPFLVYMGNHYGYREGGSE